MVSYKLEVCGDQTQKGGLDWFWWRLNLVDIWMVQGDLNFSGYMVLACSV
jgi:hypothetical protein